MSGYNAYDNDDIIGSFEYESPELKEFVGNHAHQQHHHITETDALSHGLDPFFDESSFDMDMEFKMPELQFEDGFSEFTGFVSHFKGLHAPAEEMYSPDAFSSDMSMPSPQTSESTWPESPNDYFVESPQEQFAEQFEEEQPMIAKQEQHDNTSIFDNHTHNFVMDIEPIQHTAGTCTTTTTQTADKEESSEDITHTQCKRKTKRKKSEATKKSGAPKARDDLTFLSSYDEKGNLHTPLTIDPGCKECVCGRTYKQRSRLFRHIRDVEKAECPHCHVQRNRRYIDNHIKSVHTPDIPCEYCPGKLFSKISIKQHLESQAHKINVTKAGKRESSCC